MFRNKQTADESPPSKIVLVYISWYINDYGRPWTSSDVNLRISHVHGQIAGPGVGLHATMEQKVINPLHCSVVMYRDTVHGCLGTSFTAAANNDTLTHADAQPISVHTDEVAGSNPGVPRECRRGGRFASVSVTF
jgi:hypothetical protein